MKKFWVIYWTAILPMAILAIIVLVPTNAIEAVGKFLGAVAPIITVSLAIFGVFVWRLQLVAKRRFELAEDALVAAFSVGYALESIRNPFNLSGEGRTRKSDEKETEEEKERLDRAYVPLERIATFSDKFAALEKSSLLVEAHFDKDVAAPMRDLLAARGRIFGAVLFMRALGKIRTDPPPDPSTIKAFNEAHVVLYASGDTSNKDPSYHDVLSVKIREALETVSARLRPYLAEPTLGSVFRVG